VPKLPQKKSSTNRSGRSAGPHLVTGVPKPWDDARKKLIQHKLNRLAKKMAAELGAESVIMTGFWPAPEDRDTIHLQTGGQSPYPLSVLFGHLHKKFSSAEDDNAPGDGDPIN
jgi:predicted phosphohydrolase